MTKVALSGAGGQIGSFLRPALLERGVRESDLTLIEYGSDFMRLLQARFPRARVLWMEPLRGTGVSITLTTQGALRDPGLWGQTPSA